MLPGVDGVPGSTVTVMVDADDVPHALLAVTDIAPFCPAAPEVTVMEFVPAPAVIVHPVGTVQLYVVALVTAAIEYVCPDVAGQSAIVPVIDPGVEGVPFPTVTATDAGADVPQEFPAVTVIFPLSPVAPVVTVMLFVPAPEVITQPVGTVHV
jgi:hypothetical protein